MKPSEITPEQFENWKNEMRKEFLDESNSMDLINLCLKSLDKGENPIVYNKRLMEFYQNDLASSKKLHCEHCGEKMEVYYTAQCFRCQKPTEPNYIMCRNWLRYNEKGFDSDQFWKEICKVLEKNDSYCMIPDTSSKESMLFKKHFDITIPYLFSW